MNLIEKTEKWISIFFFFYLFKSAVQIELPPIEMVSIEGEVIIFPTVTGVGQNIAATFGEAKKDVSGTTKVTEKTPL